MKFVPARTPSRMRLHAFTLIELLVVISIIAILLAILLPGLRGARKSGRLAVCESNLRQMMIGQGSYASDFRNFIAAFNGRAEDIERSYDGHPPSDFPLIEDCATQAYHIINDLGNPSVRNLRVKGLPLFPATDGTKVLQDYSHLVLFQYFSEAMPVPATVCPEDQARLSWRKVGMMLTPFQPQLAANGANDPSGVLWLPFSSSYQLVPEACAGVGPSHYAYYYQDRTGTHYQYFGKSHMGKRRFDEVAMPSQKVAIYDAQDRHFSKLGLFYAYPEARIPLAFFDGSVSVRTTSDANKGEYHLNPYLNPPATTQFTYTPDLAFESPVPAGRKALVDGYYRWTRGDLHGIDFGGAEVSQ